jgi:hypothetical protein
MLSPALPAASPAPSALVATEMRAWSPPASIVLPGALLVALLLSTQYLFQPFVWRNWPVDEVLLGWFDVASSRALTAVAIGLAVLAAGHVRTQRGSVRVALMAGAIAAGAAAGELLPLLFIARMGPHDLELALGRALQAAVVGCSVAAMFALWRRSAEGRRALQAAELRASQVEQQSAQLRLQALRSRIEPHFLFNTLATVRRLHNTDPAQGARLLDQFTAYLRWTLATEQAHQTRLGQEVDLVHAYLSVVATRMSGRLALHWDVPEALRDCVVPRCRWPHWPRTRSSTASRRSPKAARSRCGRVRSAPRSKSAWPTPAPASAPAPAAARASAWPTSAHVWSRSTAMRRRCGSSTTSRAACSRA